MYELTINFTLIYDQKKRVLPNYKLIPDFTLPCMTKKMDSNFAPKFQETLKFGFINFVTTGLK